MAQARNKRSVRIAGHRTSISLEEPFWAALAEIAQSEGLSVAALIGRIDSTRAGQTASRQGGGGGIKCSLSAAIRLYVLERLRASGAKPPQQS